MQKPALFLRNLQRLEAETIPTVVAGHEKGIERIQWLRPGKDLEPHMAVVYFNSEEAAFGALKHIQNSLFDGQKISATYKYVSSRGVSFELFYFILTWFLSSVFIVGALLSLLCWSRTCPPTPPRPT